MLLIGSYLRVVLSLSPQYQEVFFYERGFSGLYRLVPIASHVKYKVPVSHDYTEGIKYL